MVPKSGIPISSWIGRPRFTSRWGPYICSRWGTPDLLQDGGAIDWLQDGSSPDWFLDEVPQIGSHIGDLMGSLDFLPDEAPQIGPQMEHLRLSPGWGTSYWLSYRLNQIGSQIGQPRMASK